MFPKHSHTPQSHSPLCVLTHPLYPETKTKPQHSHTAGANPTMGGGERGWPASQLTERSNNHWPSLSVSGKFLFPQPGNNGWKPKNNNKKQKKQNKSCRLSLQPVTSEPQTQLSDHYTTTPLPQVARLGCSDTDSRPQKTRHKRFLKRRCIWRRTESSCLGQDSTEHALRHDTFNLYHVSPSSSLSFPLSHSTSFLSLSFTRSLVHTP